jgi:hypothetical protein
MAVIQQVISGQPSIDAIMRILVNAAFRRSRGNFLSGNSDWLRQYLLLPSDYDAPTPASVTLFTLPSA